MAQPSSDDAAAPPPKQVVEMRLWPELPGVVAVVPAPGSAKICRHHIRGRCDYGDACKFQHPMMLPPSVLPGAC